jgi:uncharacterized glyoxalase superfamily protein PhnB
MMNENEKMPSLIPVLMVEDIEDAVAFYKQLGFSEVFSIPDQKGQLVHAHLRKEDSVLFLGRLGISYYEGHERAATIKHSRSNERGIGITLILQVGNLTEIYDLVRSKKLHILTEPTDEYYGDRVFFFIDPFGYEWKISQPI